MIRNIKITILALLALSINATFAGNTDRAGEAGAYELLINPWARHSGMNGINSASIRGINSMATNVGGLSFAKKTSVSLNYTNWLGGTNTNIASLGFAQQVGEGNVIGISISNMSFGKINRTTTINPEGGIGTFSPSFFNFGIAYSRTFSNSIHGGVQVKLINEGIAEFNATGFAIDAGIQYVTKIGKWDENVHFGVAIRNIGAPVKFAGEGFSFRGESPNNGYQLSVAHKSAKFELPAQLTIAGTYDIYVGKPKNDGCYPDNRISISGNFNYNSFSNNQYGFGLEYGFKEFFMLRGGYLMEKDIFSADKTTKAHTGLAAGATFEVPLKKKGPTLSIDYSYRHARLFNGTHSIGVSIGLANPNEQACFFKQTASDAYTNKLSDSKKVEISSSDKDSIVSLAKSLRFKTGSDELNDKSKVKLDKISEFMSKYSKSNLSIEAHTDNVGKSEDNMELSKKRAESVKAYLISKGIKETRIKTAWFGDTKPLVSNDTEENQSINRRVELKIE